MGFKQTFIYLKIVKINFIKVILKLKNLFYEKIYIFFISSISQFNDRAIDSLKQIQKEFNKKNTCQITTYL
jgi:hypothetical protein